MGLSLFRILLCIILTKTGLSTQINDDGVVYQSFIYHLCHDGKAQSNLLVTCYMALDVLSRIYVLWDPTSTLCRLPVPKKA